MYRRFVIALAALAAVAASGAAQAQSNWPNQPITLIVSSNTGGSADFGSRLYASLVEKILGTRIQVENRPGASGVVAAEFLKGKAPDGYTLAQIGSGLPEAMPAMQKLPLDPIADFTYITPMTKSENYLWVRTDLPPKTVKEYVDFSKSRNGGITVGNSGLGSPASIALWLLKAKSGGDINLINYKGNAEAVNDLMAGRLESFANGYLSSRPAAEAGKARALAINSDTRSRRFPELPTYAESGYPGVAVPTWWGLIGPKGMPKEIVDKIQQAFLKASQDPELLRRYAEQDLEPYNLTPEGFLAMVKGNAERQSGIIKQLGLKLE